MTKTRKYNKTKIKATNPKDYQRQYYRKYRSGKPGRKRHGGDKK